MYSHWSERHAAFAAGLGTFSLHEGLITNSGCNARVASVITDAPREVTPRKSDDPYANCLHYAKGKCGKCIERCPGEAITEDGHDKIKCYIYLKTVETDAEKHLGPDNQVSFPVQYMDVHKLFSEELQVIDNRSRLTVITIIY